MKEISAWTVKTKTGRIYPSWIFETREEAEDFLHEIDEMFRPQAYYVVPVSLIYEQIVKT